MISSSRAKFESTQALDSLEPLEGGYANPFVNREWEIWQQAWESARQSESLDLTTDNRDPVLSHQEMEFIKNLFKTRPDSEVHLLGIRQK
jgi:hypothetical protein